MSDAEYLTADLENAKHSTGAGDWAAWLERNESALCLDLPNLKGEGGEQASAAWRKRGVKWHLGKDLATAEAPPPKATSAAIEG